jgi:hypothetical protein
MNTFVTLLISILIATSLTASFDMIVLLFNDKKTKQ